MRGRGALVALCCAVAMFGLVPGSSGAAAGSRVLVARSACFPSEFFYRPHRFQISCDITFSIHGVSWKTYGGPVAIGHGIARTKGCEPSCANGEVRLLRVTVRLSKIVTCGGMRIYAHMHWRLHGRVIPGYIHQATERMIATNEYGEPACAE